jgi:uncharacterized protein
MPRPKKCRYIGCNPRTLYFKPRGIPLFQLEETSLDMDELEAVRLADYEGMYHEDAAEKMNISRSTFGRILGNARRKVADAIVNGKALKIDKMMDKPIEKEEN